MGLAQQFWDFWCLDLTSSDLKPGNWLSLGQTQQWKLLKTAFWRPLKIKRRTWHNARFWVLSLCTSSQEPIQENQQRSTAKQRFLKKGVQIMIIPSVYRYTRTQPDFALFFFECVILNKLCNFLWIMRFVAILHVGQFCDSNYHIISVLSPFIQLSFKQNHSYRLPLCGLSPQNKIAQEAHTYLSTPGVPKSGDVSKSSRCKNACYDNVRILSENHPKAFRMFPMCFTTMSECSPRIPRKLSEFSRHRAKYAAND